MNAKKPSKKSSISYASSHAWSPGSFGAIVDELDLTWREIGLATGLDKSILFRWAQHSDNGIRIVVRTRADTVYRVFEIINEKERSVGGNRTFTPGMFGIVFTRIQGKEDKVLARAEDHVQTALSRIIEELALGAGNARDQFRIMREIGQRARAATNKAAWMMVWKRFCSAHYPNTYKNAVLTFPSGVRVGV